MKIYSYLAITTFLCIMLSCNLVDNDDNDISLENLYGTWELSTYQEESELFYVNTYEFNEDGLFEYRMTARQQGSDLDLGYNSVISGTYSLVGNSLTLEETKFLTLPEGSTIWYNSLDELVEQEWSRESEITVTLKERKSELVIDYGPCPPNALCIGPRTFYRVATNR